MPAEKAGALPQMRGPGARIPGWHSAEVTEALRHFAGAKEAVREVADTLRVSAGSPEEQAQRHHEVLAASLYGFAGNPQDEGFELRLARVIGQVKLAAQIAQLPALGQIRRLPSASASPGGKPEVRGEGA